MSAHLSRALARTHPPDQHALDLCAYAEERGVFEGPASDAWDLLLKLDCVVADVRRIPQLEGDVECLRSDLRGAWRERDRLRDTVVDVRAAAQRLLDQLDCLGLLEEGGDRAAAPKLLELAKALRVLL